MRVFLRFGINLLNLTIQGNQSASLFAAYMNHHCIGRVPVKRMAVNTLLPKIPVFRNGSLPIRCQVTLINPHLVPKLISGIKQTIRQKRIYFMSRYTILNIGITHPSAMLFNRDSKIYFFAGSFFQQGLPLFFRYADYRFVILNQHVAAFFPTSYFRLESLPFLLDSKVRRSDIHRESYIRIIRINQW